MGFDECYHLGNVVKTHGLKGEVVFFLDVDFPEAYEEMESVFVELNGKLVPFFIESILLQGDRAIVALDEVASLEDAQPLIGKELYLPLSQLPPLPEGKYYFHQLPGLEFYDGEKLIGQVTQVYQMPGNNLLAIEYQGIEVLVPLTDQIVHDVNLKQGKITSSLPEGLLDVYLDQPS